MTRVLLVSFGSKGDVHPLLALGRGLQERGHEAIVLTNPLAEDDVRRAGLDFHAIGRIEDGEATMAHPKLWHPIDGLGVMWRYLLRPALKPTYEAIETLAAGTRSVVVASPVAMGARIAQERLGVPLVNIYTAATQLRSSRGPLSIASWEVPAWMPRACIGMAWRALDRAKLEPLVRPALEGLRGSLGLGPIRESVFGQWMHSPEGGVALFPQWFAPRADDWPQQVQQAGFALHDEPAAEPLPPALETFLRAGPPPIVFMPGTAQHDTREFFAAARRACEHTGHRGVLLGRIDAQSLAALPATLHAQPYASFASLLPRSRALVHHGGVGTCAQGLRAGLPQIVAPMGYDQFDNAMRLRRLGVGRALPNSARRWETMPRALAALLEDVSVRAACATHAGSVNREAAIDSVAAMVESLA
jgi:rhamnosyltransferase subunit B